MATSSGKKVKKTSKKNKLSLGEFLTDGNAAAVSQVQVAVPIKLRDWADECDDDEDDRPTRTQLIALPTAPRASRLLNDDTLPMNPPYSAYISNLPYNLDDNDLYEFFNGMEIVSLRLPREDGDSGRLRGFGYIEFAKRQDLIEALSIPEPLIQTRRIRIDLSSENDQRRQQRSNRNYDNYGGDSDRSMGNWRDGPRPNADRDQGPRRNYNNYNRDRGDRESDRDRYPDGGSSNWRLGERPAQAPPSSPPSSRRGYDRGDRDRGDRGFRRGLDRSGERGARRDAEPQMERPKLVLQPRTLPLPERPKPEPEADETEGNTNQEPKYDSGNEVSDDKENLDQPESRPKPTPVPSANVFGEAKPVDTAARLKAIEERMQEKQRQEQEERQKKAAVAALSSGDEEGKEKSDPSKDETEQHSEDKPEEKPENINWRVRSDSDKAGERRGNSPMRRLSPTRKYNRRNGDYDYPDNRDMRDNRDRGMNRDNRNMRDNRRDYNRPSDRDRGFRTGERDRDVNRGVGRDMRDNQDKQEPARSYERGSERELKPIEDRMPKFQEPSGPNLSMKNTFEGLSADEIDD